MKHSKASASLVASAAIALGGGVGLAWLFWSALFSARAGFLGGDIYNYYFPLRQLYSQGLQSGGVHLWHPGIGNGVPVLGESQTGAFYLPYAVAYRWLDLAAAYNAVFLFHYVLAFVGTFSLGRVLALGNLASALAATAFVYGWFPERACLEWAIVTGAWCPIVMALAIGVLEGRTTTWRVGLVAAVAMQLLAGHFQLAFVTIVGVAAVAASKLVVRRDAATTRAVTATLVCLALGFAAAAPQLVPAWLLKNRSQRQEDAFAKSVDFGNVPIWYWTQMIFPDEVYPQSEELIRRHGSTTNLVEAQLYPGRMTLILLATLPFNWRRVRSMGTSFGGPLPWLLLTVIGLVLAEGSVFRWLSQLPGFGYFRYPGRYGMLAALGAAVVAGHIAQALFVWPNGKLGVRLAGCLVGISCLGLSIADFYLVRHVRGENQIGYATLAPEAPIRLLKENEVVPKLPASARVLAMDGNTMALFGCSCVPPYLGLGPAEYYEIWGKFPNVFRGEVDWSPRIAETLEKMGVSHIMTEKPLPPSWKLHLEWSGYSPFLHTRWGRPSSEPLYLYRIGRFFRAYAVDEQGLRHFDSVDDSMLIEPHRIVFHAKNARNRKLLLTDLAYPGWRGSIVSGVSAGAGIGRSETIGMFRAIGANDATVTVSWHYVDVGMLWGLGVFAAGAIAACGWMGWQKKANLPVEKDAIGA